MLSHDIVSLTPLQLERLVYLISVSNPNTRVRICLISHNSTNSASPTISTKFPPRIHHARRPSWIRSDTHFKRTGECTMVWRFSPSNIQTKAFRPYVKRFTVCQACIHTGILRYTIVTLLPGPGFNFYLTGFFLALHVWDPPGALISSHSPNTSK